MSSNDGTYGRLGKTLEQQRLLTKERFRDATRRAREQERFLTHLLLEEADAASVEGLAAALADFHGTPVVSLRQRSIPQAILELIPRELAEEHSIIVFGKSKSKVQVATTTPENQQVIDVIRRRTGLEPEVHLTTPRDLRAVLQRYGGDLIAEFARIIEDSTREALTAHAPVEQLAQFVPIVTMVKTLLERALRSQASDIHLEPNAQRVVVRYRIDGLLAKVVELPLTLLPALVTRVKLLANLKIDEHRLPQDGRFSLAFGDREVAVRVSAVPTLHGTKIVLRLLDATAQRLTLPHLGLNRLHEEQLRAELRKPHGMVLVTGPTGSGKTTTLYALLRELNQPAVNICTIEDPIEYGIEGISQTQVNPNAGLTFANGLRSLLRQDPNIIMVGEIRDTETADIAVNAAMTGHLVLSTLHTNTAALTVQRLVEMGVEPFLAASVINVIVGQRLVRRVCKSCRAAVRTPAKLLEEHEAALGLKAAVARLVAAGLLPKDSTLKDTQLMHGRGCDECSGTGYQGRVGIYEVLRIDDAVHQAILQDPTARSVEAAAGPAFLRMGDDGVLKVLTGATTFDEVLRVMR